MVLVFFPLISSDEIFPVLSSLPMIIDPLIVVSFLGIPFLSVSMSVVVLGEDGSVDGVVVDEKLSAAESVSDVGARLAEMIGSVVEVEVPNGVVVGSVEVAGELVAVVGVVEVVEAVAVVVEVSVDIVEYSASRSGDARKMKSAAPAPEITLELNRFEFIC